MTLPDGAARPPGTAAPPGGAAGVVCVGGVVVDRHLHLLAPPVPATSNPARGATSAGGVARNVAENLVRLGAPARLVSRVGDDDAGRWLLRRLAAAGVDASGVAVVPGEVTAQYVAVLDPAGELVLGAAAMTVLDGLTCADVDAAWPGPDGWVLLDCNVPAPLLAHARGRAAADGTALAVEAVSVPKVVRLAAGRATAGDDPLGGVAVLFANLDEAGALARALAVEAVGGEVLGGDGSGAEAAGALARALVAAGAGTVVVTRGAAGAVVADAAGWRAVPARPAHVVDVTGAGDALVAGTLAALVAGVPVDDAVRAGCEAAARTVASPGSVIPGTAAAGEGAAAPGAPASFAR